MRSFINLGKTLSVVAFIAIVAGCGSSDDGGASGGDATLSGVFIDTAVEGLNYDCQPSGFTGLTDANGTYSYKAGDTCTFSVPSSPDNIILGTTIGSGIVTPVDFLVGNDGNRLVNILMLLQSLDSDGDLDNGIQIPAGLHGDILADITSDGEDVWDDSLTDFLWLSNGIADSVSAAAALEHFYSSTTPFFQTVLREEMFTDKQFILADGIMTFVVDNGEYKYELALYGESAPCYGNWSVDSTKLNLLEDSCALPGYLGLITNKPYDIDFNDTPAAHTALRAKIGSGPYDYGFEKIARSEVLTVPSAPSDLNNSEETITASSAIVSWNDNSDNEAYFTIGYVINSGFQLLQYASVMGSNDNNSSVKLNFLQEGTEYRYTVTARNKAGMSEESEVATFQTKPAAPSNLQWTVAGSGADVTITVTWNDNSTHETGYNVYIYDPRYPIGPNNLFGGPVNGTSYSGDTSELDGMSVYVRAYMVVDGVTIYSDLSETIYIDIQG